MQACIQSANNAFKLVYKIDDENHFLTMQSRVDVIVELGEDTLEAVVRSKERKHLLEAVTQPNLTGPNFSGAAEKKRPAL